MAKVEDAKLSVAGSGDGLVMTVEVELDWDRGDDQAAWEIQVRFLGADVGGDEVVLVHAVPASPADGRTKRIDISGAGGVFDEDRGDDEIHAEVELRARTSEVRTVTTNTVKGDFSA